MTLSPGNQAFIRKITESSQRFIDAYRGRTNHMEVSEEERQARQVLTWVQAQRHLKEHLRRSVPLNAIENIATDYLAMKAKELPLETDGLRQLLTNASIQLRHYNFCHKHLESTDTLLQEIDAALARTSLGTDGGEL